MNRILQYLKNPKKLLLYLDNKNIIKMSDKKYIKIRYEISTGKKIDLENPQTFNEKLQWLKLNDRKDEYTNMVDKCEAKKYVASIIGNEYIIPTLGVYNDFEEIDFRKLPNQFVIKCTHDSGGIVICKDKEKLDLDEAKKKISQALKKNYYTIGREWPYKNVKPRIIIEKYMEEMNAKELIDYKMLCFNGKVRCSFVCLNRTSQEGLNVDFYDMNWNKLPFERHYKNSDVILKRPKNYDLMIELSEKLAKKHIFLRVDFYEVSGQIYFGELTFHPGSGLEEFNPNSWDKTLGDWMDLEKK